MKRDLYPEAFPFQSPFHSLHPSQCCLQQSLDGSHIRWWWWRRWSIIFQAYRFVGTPLAWWLLTWHGHLYWHSSQPWSPLCNLLLLHPQTDRPLLPVPFTLKLVSLVSLHLEMQLAITSTSGTEKGRHHPPTSYTATCYQCLSTACWSTDPVPAAPFIQSSLCLPYSIDIHEIHTPYWWVDHTHQRSICWLHCHSLLQFCLLLFRMDIGSGYRRPPVVPAVPFIHNSMVMGSLTILCGFHTAMEFHVR